MIDLTTRQQVATNTLQVEQLKYRDWTNLHIKNAYHLANPNGIKQFPFVRYEDDPSGAVTAVWEWNPFTNAMHCSREFPHADRLEISLDGSTLLEMERLTPMLPQLLLPTNLGHALGGLAEAQLKTSDLMIHRVWSLPAMTKLLTVSLHHLECSRHSAFLTGDDSHLVLSSSSLPRGYTSSRSSFTEPVRDSPKEHYIFQPVRNQIVDVTNGKVVWEKPDSPEWFTADPNVQNTSNDAVSYHSAGHIFALYLPTMAWLPEKMCKGSKRLNKNESHAFFVDNSTEGTAFRFLKDGTFQQIAQYSVVGGFAVMVPQATQVLLFRQVQRIETLPDWLTEFLRNHNWLQDWVNEQWNDYSVIDYEKNRVIWSQKSDAEYFELTDRWLKFEQKNPEANTLTVTVYALPFPSWSPWWSRVAGLVVFVSLLYFLRRWSVRG